MNLHSTARAVLLTIKLDRPQLSPADVEKLQAGMTEKAISD